MRTWVAALLMLLTPVAALAEGEISQEQLQRMYDNVVAQLRAAQERRNELATEKEKLLAKVSELQKRLAESRGDAASLAASTFQLRAEYGAFQDFLRHNPAISLRWQWHMKKDILSAAETIVDQLGADWPFSALR